jgi:hypothetical protein
LPASEIIFPPMNGVLRSVQSSQLKIESLIR